MPVFVIFVEGADTEPAKLPVYIVESEEHASLICDGMKESDYHIFDFSFKHCTRSERGKFAVWATMICDARKGVYGNIVGGIYKMIDGAYSIMSGQRSREKIASGGDTETGNGGSTTAKQDDETADENGQPPAVQLADAADGMEIPKQSSAADKWFTTDPEKGSRYKHGPIEGTLKQLEQWLKAGSQPTLRKHNGQSWWYIRKLVGRRYAVWCDSQTKHAEANRRRLEEENRATKSNEAQVVLEIRAIVAPPDLAAVRLPLKMRA